MKKILLTRGKVALVDDSDFESLSEFKWMAGGNWAANKIYACRSITVAGKRKTIRMAREILNAPEHMVVDHINGDTLDNRRENLRICTRRENRWNRLNSASETKYFGVTYNKDRNKFYASIGHAGKQHFIGEFENPVEAAIAYDACAFRLRGEFVSLNFPGSRELELLQHTKELERELAETKALLSEADEDVRDFDKVIRENHELRSKAVSPAVEKIKLALEHYRAIEPGDDSIAHQALLAYEREKGGGG